MTNIWQAVYGGQFITLVRRLWLFLCMAVAMVHVGAQLFHMFETALLLRGLGALLLLYALFGLIGRTPKLLPRQERFFGPICGAVNGLLAGLTGVMFVPGTIFLQAIGLSRDLFVQAMGMLFAASTASLGLALYRHNMMPFDIGVLSVGALLPAFFGMWLGQALRSSLSQNLFRRLFFRHTGLGSYTLLFK